MADRGARGFAGEGGRPANPRGRARDVVPTPALDNPAQKMETLSVTSVQRGGRRVLVVHQVREALKDHVSHQEVIMLSLNLNKWKLLTNYFTLLRKKDLS